MSLHIAERRKDHALLCPARPPRPDLAPRCARNARPLHRERSGHDGQAAISLYLREVGRVRPLKPLAQAGLAARIRKGDWRARELMIKSNLPLVVEIARQYEDIGLPLLDLVGEGNIGLLKALEHLDSTEAAMFPAYLSWWIRQSIKRALAKQPKTSLSRHL